MERTSESKYTQSKHYIASRACPRPGPTPPIHPFAKRTGEDERNLGAHQRSKKLLAGMHGRRHTRLQVLLGVLKPEAQGNILIDRSELHGAISKCEDQSGSNVWLSKDSQHVDASHEAPATSVDSQPQMYTDDILANTSASFERNFCDLLTPG